MKHSSRQRRILENAGVMDVGGAAPAAVEPAQAAVPAEINPDISMQGDSADFVTVSIAQLDKVMKELPKIIQKAGAEQAPYAQGLVKVAEGLGELRKQLDGLKEQLQQGSQEPPEASVPSAPPPAPTPAPAPAPAAPAAPAPAPVPTEGHDPQAANAMDPNDDDFEVNYGSPKKYGYKKVGEKWIAPEDVFRIQLDAIFEDGGVMGRQPKMLKTVWQPDEGQKPGKNSRGTSSSAGDSAFKNEGTGKTVSPTNKPYGSTGGFS